MLGIYTLFAVLLLAINKLVLLPVYRYIRDPKGFRKYPNYAWLSGITDFRHSYLASQGFRSKDLYHAHTEREQKIIRIGPNSLSFCDNRAIKDIYGHNTKCLKDVNSDILSGSHRNLFDVVKKPDHARKRKQLSAAFALKNLEKWEYKSCTGPPKDASSPPSLEELTVEFNHWINLWTIEAINSITLSAEMDLLDHGTDWVPAERRDGTKYKARYRHSLNNLAISQSVFVWDYDLWPWAEWLSKTLPTKWRGVWDNGKPWDDINYHQCTTRLQRHMEGEKLDDFFTCMVEDKTGQPSEVEWGEIVSEVGALLNAGSDTTAISLTHVLELLIKHPQYMEMLRKEIDQVLEPDEIIASYDKVKDLPFLRACIDEALRVIPPVSAGLPRRTPAEGAYILGEWIPGNTSVSMTIYSAHRDASIFPEPDQFRPTRWMDPEERKRMEPSLIPFTTGSRGCIGRNISYLEQLMMLASLVHRYEFALPSSDWELPRYEAFNIICGEMPIKIWRRNLECHYENTENF